MTLTTIADRTLPHNLEAEASVLGVVLVSPAAWPIVSAVLTADDFYRDAHRRIFLALMRLAEKSAPLDFIALHEELRATAELDAVGGPAYVSGLSGGVPRSTNVEYYARIVKEKAILRNAIFAANAVLGNAYEEVTTPAEVIEDGVRRLLALSAPSRSGAVAIGAAVSEYVSSLDSDQGVGLMTGLVDLDDLIGGLKKGSLTIIAARPSVGKSTFAVNVADTLSRNGVPSVMFSLEMSQRAVAAQVLAQTAQLDAIRIARKMLSAPDWTRLSDALEALADRPFYVVTGSHTVTQVDAWSRRLITEHGAQVVFVDYLQLMATDNRRNREQEIAYLSAALKRLAVQQDIAVVALSQLSRAPEARKDKRPQLSDLRESGALEQDADLVLLLFRQDMYDHDPNSADAGIAEIIVAKHRSGPTGVAKACFLKEQCRFTNLAR